MAIRCHMSFVSFYMTKHYLINIILNAVLCIGLNTLLDYYSFEDSRPPYYIFGISFVLKELLPFMTLLPLGLVGMTPCIRAEIIKGNTQAIHPDCFEFHGSPVRRFFLFAMRERHWGKRALKFLVQAWICPGLVVFLSMLFFCWCDSDFKQVEWEKTCYTNNIWYRVLWLEIWKVVSLCYLWSLNYAMTHNASQRQLHEAAEDAETGDPLAEGKQVDYGLAGDEDKTEKI